MALRGRDGTDREEDDDVEGRDVGLRDEDVAVSDIDDDDDDDGGGSGASD